MRTDFASAFGWLPCCASAARAHDNGVVGSHTLARSNATDDANSENEFVIFKRRWVRSWRVPTCLLILAVLFVTLAPSPSWACACAGRWE